MIIFREDYTCSVQNGFRKFFWEIGCVPECCVPIFRGNNYVTQIKQACLFRGLSVQLLIVLKAGLDGRFFTLFNLWLGCIEARQTC